MADVRLDLLQQMVQRVLDSQRETREDVREIKARLGRLKASPWQRELTVSGFSKRCTSQPLGSLPGRKAESRTDWKMSVAR
jgi:hypothetical protein